MSVQVGFWLLLVPAELWVLALILVLRTFRKGKAVGRASVPSGMPRSGCSGVAVPFLQRWVWILSSQGTGILWVQEA